MEIYTSQEWEVFERKQIVLACGGLGRKLEDKVTENGRSQIGNSKGTLRWIIPFSKKFIRKLLMLQTKVLKRVHGCEREWGSTLLGFMVGGEGRPPATTPECYWLVAFATGVDRGKIQLFLMPGSQQGACQFPQVQLPGDAAELFLRSDDHRLRDCHSRVPAANSPPPPPPFPISHKI